MSSMTIVIDDSNLTATIHTKDDSGIINDKEVSVEDLAATFASRANLSTGLLPLGCRYYNRSDHKELYAIEVEPSTRVVKHGSSAFTIPVPRTLICVGTTIDAAGKRLSRTSIVALGGPFFTKDDPVYNYPFANVYAGDGSICWGSNRVIGTVYPNAVGLGSLIDLFFNAPFNNDLDSNSFKFFQAEDDEGKRVGTTRSLFEYLDGKDTFPNNILLPMGLATFNGYINDFSEKLQGVR